MIKKLSSTFLMLLFVGQLFAQTQETAVMQSIHNNGKIYVVVAVVLIILIGLLAYLFAMDRRIKMLEKKSNTKN